MGMMRKLLKAGHKVHYIICSYYGYTDKKTLLQLQTEFMFVENKEMKEYKKNMRFSHITEQGFSLSSNLQKISELIKRCEHIFVDEFQINVKYTEGAQKKLKEIKRITEVNQLILTVRKCHYEYEYLQGKCFWIASAGVRLGRGASQYPDKSEFQKLFPGFHIPEMKLPLRYVTEYLHVCCMF